MSLLNEVVALQRDLIGLVILVKVCRMSRSIIQLS
jgi:hypothetical protein